MSDSDSLSNSSVVSFNNTIYNDFDELVASNVLICQDIYNSVKTLDNIHNQLLGETYVVFSKELENMHIIAINHILKNGHNNFGEQLLFYLNNISLIII